MDGLNDAQREAVQHGTGNCAHAGGVLPFILPLVLWLAGCAAMPDQGGRTVSTALQDTGSTRLGRSVASLAQGRPGLTGIVALPQGLDAFAARARLADVAERSLDLQTYIWRDDMSGGLLFDAVRRAADRGVRVRLLLDDNNTAGMDEMLWALDSHRNVEVRLFNPTATRQWRALGYLTDFRRQNRRMHNKSFTADNQVTIIGGRNMGDAYFGADPNLQFVDLDVMALGAIVPQVSEDFDRYWASDSAYPAERVLAPSRRAKPAAPEAAGAARAAATALYLEALERQDFVRGMIERRLPIEWAQVRMVSDDPAKGQGLADEDDLLLARLKRIVKQPLRELHLVSPYFVPGAQGVQQLAGLARGGVRVTVLTNSLEATDVAAVHAGYARRRKALLESGVTLFEMKRAAGAASAERTIGSSSASSLHAKTFAVDRSAIFVGSFNFDPRSKRLNTELGFVIDSPALASATTDAITSRLAAQAYRIRLAPDGALQWVEQVQGREVVHDQEPGAGFWRQLGVALLALLPIEWML